MKNLVETEYPTTMFWEKEITKSYPYVVVPNFLSEDECDYIMAIQDKQDEVMGTVANTSTYSPMEKGVESTDYRKVDVTWVLGYEERDIYRNVWDRVSKINDETFGYQISQVQDFMLCRYGEGHYFLPHYDAFAEAPKREFRKLTMTILLNEPEEFEGAIDIYEGEKPTSVQHNKRGSAILFPPWSLHAVEPIKSGCRRVMVCWFVGERYR